MSMMGQVHVQEATAAALELSVLSQSLDSEARTALASEAASALSGFKNTPLSIFFRFFHPSNC